MIRTFAFLIHRALLCSDGKRFGLKIYQTINLAGQFFSKNRCFSGGF